MNVDIEEWCRAEEHLVDDDAQGPPIDRFFVDQSLDDLWGLVLACAHVCLSELVLVQNSRQAEVYYLNVAFTVEHQVF